MLREVTDPSHLLSEMDTGMLHVLVVDDDPADLKLCEAYLRPHFRFSGASSAAEAFDLIQADRPDCVITDYNLGATDGVSLATEFYGLPGMRYVPCIMLTGHSAVEIATHAFKAGADDYISKKNLSEQQLVYAVKAAYLDKRMQEAADVERHSLVQRNLEIEKRHQMMTEYWLGIAHTILTPLASTQEFISLVMDGVGGEVTETQGKYLGYARGGCNTIEAAVMRIVKMADLSSDPSEVYWRSHSLVEAVEEALDEIRIDSERMGVAIATQYALQPDVLGDKNALTQLLHLLQQRCLWYAAQRGKLAISVSAAADPDMVMVCCEGSTDHAVTALADELEWQLSAALSQANASNFQVVTATGKVQYRFELMRCTEVAQPVVA